MRQHIRILGYESSAHARKNAADFFITLLRVLINTNPRASVRVVRFRQRQRQRRVRAVVAAPEPRARGATPWPPCAHTDESTDAYHPCAQFIPVPPSIFSARPRNNLKCGSVVSQRFSDENEWNGLEISV